MAAIASGIICGIIRRCRRRGFSDRAALDADGPHPCWRPLVQMAAASLAAQFPGLVFRLRLGGMDTLRVGPDRPGQGRSRAIGDRDPERSIQTLTMPAETGRQSANQRSNG
jgi:hypothetical protein